jgi:hypothetical protein
VDLPVLVLFGLCGQDLLSGFGGDKLKEALASWREGRLAFPADSRGLSGHRAVLRE